MRLRVAVLSIALAFVVFVVGIGLPLLWPELLFALAIIAMTGLVPFVVGIFSQSIWRKGLIPAYAPWAFGVVLGLLRLFVGRQGGLVVLNSVPLSAVMTVLISSGFAELGIATALALRRRRGRQ